MTARSSPILPAAKAARRRVSALLSARSVCRSESHRRSSSALTIRSNNADGICPRDFAGSGFACPHIIIGDEMARNSESRTRNLQIMLQRGRINEFAWSVFIGSTGRKTSPTVESPGEKVKSVCMYRRDPVRVKGRVSDGGVHQCKRRLVQNERSASWR